MNIATSPSAELWHCLRQMRSLSFVATSGSATGWSGNGSGEVLVACPADDVLTFTESGSWQPATGNELRFRNAYRWTLTGPQLIKLEHLRFGEQHPVYLFDVAPVTNTLWKSVSPHHCREDEYSAELHIKAQGMALRWVISGPQKQEVIEYEYSHRPIELSAGQ